jgi:hypothetical protein
MVSGPSSDSANRRDGLARQAPARERNAERNVGEMCLS